MQHVFTTLRWYNSAPDENGTCRKIACASGTGFYEALTYGQQVTRQFHAAGAPPHPQYGQYQEGIATSRITRTLVIDVDYLDSYLASALATVLPAESATSYRVTPSGEMRLHFVIAVPEDLLGLWPVQGERGMPHWGDVKSAGFSMITGVHYSGTQYVKAAATPEYIVATSELLTAISAEPRVERQGTGTATGAVSGSWHDEDYAYADGTKDNRGSADVASMVTNGLTDADITERMTAILLRSENYGGQGEEVQRWIASARAKYGLAEGESYTSRAQEADRAFFGPLAERAGLTWEQFQDSKVHQANRAVEWRQRPFARDLGPITRDDAIGTTDQGLARFILGRTQPYLRYAADSETWLVNEGETWRPSRGGADGLIADIADLWEYAEASTDVNPGAEETEAEKVKRWNAARARLLSNAGHNAIKGKMISCAQSRGAVNSGDLDSEAHILWAGGYAWDLRASLTEPTLAQSGTCNDVHLHSAAVTPSLVPTPAWNTFLEVLWPEADVRAWALREIAGVALWGDTSKRHPVLDGPASSGKSTFANALLQVLGTYAVQVSPGKLIGGRMDSSSEEATASLIGARLAWMDEPPARNRQSISQFNELASGTGSISAARKYQGQVTSHKRFNFLICQNERNRLQFEAQGVSERVTFIPCQAEQEDVAPAAARLEMALKDELPGILAFLITECAQYRAGNRFEMPLSVEMEMEDARDEGDEFQAWLYDNYRVMPADMDLKARQFTIGQIRDTYNDTHAKVNGIPKLGRAEMRQRLESLGVHVHEASYNGRPRLLALQALPLGFVREH